jgi:hypothetical protein|eukprot:jgi/Chrpa1/8267/Chrysochromulina_OHIO_Genome00017152-RA
MQVLVPVLGLLDWSSFLPGIFDFVLNVLYASFIAGLLCLACVCACHGSCRHTPYEELKERKEAPVGRGARRRGELKA